MNIKKYFYSPFFYLVLAIVGYFGFTQIADVDFGFHLAQGKYFFENNWRLPIKEVYSYPIAGQTNIILSWLFDVGIYFSYLKLGFFGISSWKALALAALALLFILRLEKLTAARNIKITEWFAYGAAFMFLAGVYLWANIERPHALGYLYFSLFLLFIDDFLNSPQKWHWIFFAVLQIFWTNTHTSFTVSLIVLTIFIAGLYWKLLENKKYPKTCREEELSKIRGQIKSLIQLLILLAVVSMINPYGPAIFPNFFLKASPPVVYRFIQELWPMHMVELWSVKGVLWFLSIFPIINFWRKKDYKMVLLFLFFALLGIRSNRFTFDYVVLTAPFSVLEFFVFWPSIFINLTAGLSLTLIFLLIFIWSATASQKTRGMGFSNNDFPIAAANFILQNNIKGNMYNSFGMGSYLIWHLYPRYQVFIDSRAQNYIQGGQNSLLADYSRISEDISAWGKMDEKYNFDFAIVDWPSITDNKSYNITEQNFTADKWAVVFMDSRALVYLKRTEANKQLIDKYEYKYIKPQELDLSYFQEYLSDSPKWLYAQQEIRRLLDQRPDNYRAHFIYSAFLAQNPASNKEEIIAHLKKTIDLDPSFDQARKALKSLFGINY